MPLDQSTVPIVTIDESQRLNLRAAHARIERVLLIDRERLRKRLKASSIAAIEGELVAAEARVHVRLAARPTVLLNDDLPISARFGRH